MATDDELAELWIDQELPEFEPRFSESGPMIELLRAIYDRLGLVINATVAVSGNKTLKLEPYPRAVSAIERIRERQTQRTRELFVQRLRALQQEA